MRNEMILINWETMPPSPQDNKYPQLLETTETRDVFHSLLSYLTFKQASITL